MNRDELRDRSKRFALQVIRLCAGLQGDDLVRVVRPQLLRSGTGTAANYRSTCRSRSDREFVSRMGLVIEEADETEFWLDVLQTEHYGPAPTLRALAAEAVELRAIFSASRTTVLERLKREAAEAEASKLKGCPHCRHESSVPRTIADE